MEISKKSVTYFYFNSRFRCILKVFELVSSEAGSSSASDFI